jgi:serine/threonine protein kinase
MEDKDLKLVFSEIGKNYVLEKKLGSGGYSTVYLIRHKILETKFALKVMDTEYIEKSLQKGDDTEEVEQELSVIKRRFINGGKLCINIRHPNIVAINDVGIASDKDKNHEVPYLILEYIKGQSLSQKISREIPAALYKIFKISKDILSAIGEIHKRGIIHRDIKSRNVMIRESTGEAVLIDFGIAKGLEESMSMTERVLSERFSRYMPPEQFHNFRNVDERGDIYSFGVVLFEMITGETPFKGTRAEIMHGHVYGKIHNILEKNSEAPPEFQKIIEKAMAKKPEDRYQSAEEFLSAIKELEIKLKKRKKYHPLPKKLMK